jgi:hypothetical protein
MDLSTLRQAKAIGDQADAFHHLKGAGILWTQLATGSQDQRLGGSVKKAEPNPVVDGELQQAVMCIIMPFGICLSLQQTFLNIGEEGVTVTQQHISCLCGCRTCRIWHQSRRRATIYHLKWLVL